jgi:activator of HSP90 ATPase
MSVYINSWTTNCDVGTREHKVVILFLKLSFIILKTACNNDDDDDEDDDDILSYIYIFE